MLRVSYRVLPTEEISKLESKRKEYEMDLERCHIDIGNCRRVVEDRDRELGELTKQIQQATQTRKSKNDLLGCKVSLAQQSADAIEKIYQQFAEDMRQKIEARVAEHLQEIDIEGRALSGNQAGTMIIRLR